jgi:hypothetical protein
MLQRLLNASEALLLSAAVSLTVFSLQWRYGFNLGDEGWLWYISQRTALGDVPLRDFFSYDPGRYYWSAAVFKLTGSSGLYQQILANYLFAIIGLAAAYFVMVRAERARSWRIAILLLLGVVIGFPRHKIYEQTLSLVAVATIAFLFDSPRRLNRWFLCGIVIGLAAFFGRNSGVFCLLAVVVAFVVLRIRGEAPPTGRAVGAVAAGTLLGYLPMILMIIGIDGFAEPFFQSVPLTPRWAWSLKIPFPWHVHLRGLGAIDRLQARAVAWLCVAVPLTYAVILWRSVRRRAVLSSVEWLSVAASAAGAGFLLHAFYTADFFHIAEGVVPFVIAALALSSELWRGRARPTALAIFCATVFLILASWLPMEPLAQHLKNQAQDGAERQISIDRKSFYVPAEQADIMHTVAAAFLDCRPHNGGFFAAPYYPGLYAYLNTRASSWDTYFLWPRSDQTQQAEIEALQKNHTSIILLNPQFALNGRESLELVKTNPKLVEYIRANYQRSAVHLPEGFELYYSPQECANVTRG